MYPIDFVVTWVDGSDPEWLMEKNSYIGKIQNSGNMSNRFRNWDLFKYWFRSVETNAPWVNKIFLVTCGHYPDWLNKNNSKLRLVNHTDYIPNDCLPTFNSNAIELYLYRIKELSEHFVLFNDDMFLTSKTGPEDFFVDGKPCDEALLEAINSIDPNDIFAHTLLNNSSIINKHFCKRKVLKQNITKFINFKYGRDMIRNLLLIPFENFSGFKDLHLPTSHTKTGFQFLWDEEAEILSNTGHTRFRASTDVTHWLIKNWRICTGEFVPRRTSWGKRFEIGADTDICESIQNNKWKAVCLNDSKNDLDFDKEKEKMQVMFKKLFPQKSTFEL